MAELIDGGRPLFQGFHDQGQLGAIFEVLGAPDDSVVCYGTPFTS